MKQKLAAAIFGLVLASTAGCSDLVSPHEQVITKPDKRDFGLVGTWKHVETDPRNPQYGGDWPPMTVSRDETGVYKLASHDKRFPEKISFRVVHFDDGQKYAIVEVEVSNLYESGRFLAMTLRDERKLYVSFVESQNLAKYMHTEGFSAVIERSSFSTTVYAKPEELLECIRRHGRDLVGKPSTYELVP